MIKINPSKLNGKITIQASKSVLHRQLICAALATGKSEINNFMLSEDTAATLSALKAMGYCKYGITGKKCSIIGGLNKNSKDEINCGESGSTLRFLIPLGFDGKKRIFTGCGRLLERPMQPYEDIFKIGYVRKNNGIEVNGSLKSGEYRVDGGISSQFITGLLYKLPLLDGDSHIILTSNLESRPYVDITRSCQTQFGVESVEFSDGYGVVGGQKYQPAKVWAEGDYSHAAFFAVAAAIGGRVKLEGLKQDSLQGDREILNILSCMGAKVCWDEDIAVVEQNVLKPIELDVSQIPDLVPILTVLACAVVGKTRIFGARRLRFKESDRLSAMAEELEKLGADIIEYEDSLVINGTGKLKGAQACSHGDHRVAMALSIASCIADGDIVIDKPAVVAKSAPEFFEEFRSLGGSVN